MFVILHFCSPLPAPILLTPNPPPAKKKKGGGVRLWKYSLAREHKIRFVGLVLKKVSWVRYPVWQHTFVSPSAFSRRAVVSYWRKYVHEVLVNRLGGLSLPRKSVVRLTDRPDMTLDVYRGRKTTKQTNLKRFFGFYLFLAV